MRLKKKSITSIILPYIIAILFVIMNLSSIKIAGISNIMPLFDLMAIFYFAVLKRDFQVWFIFLLGIWADSINGSPLGTTSLCYILLVKFFIFLNSKMLIREDFSQVWQQFIAFAFLFLLIKWFILSLFIDEYYSFATPLIQLTLSSIFYVVMHKVFDYNKTT